MLQYQKTILDKVSFDKQLFRKELIKSFKWLSASEIDELHQWAEMVHKDNYADVLTEVFPGVAA